MEQEGEKKLADSPVEVSSEILARVEAIYEKGLYRQAYELASSAGALKDWRGVHACILAGRICHNLGDPRQACRHHVRAYRSDPSLFKTRAYYVETMLALRGPWAAWQKFRQMEPKARAAAGLDCDEIWEYLMTLGARICGHMRDFEGAEDRWRVIEERRPVSAWLMVEKATLAMMRERWNEGLAFCQRALEIRPWYRPAVQQMGHQLHTMGKDDEAIKFLREASERVESVAVLSQLALLQMDLENYTDAVETLGRMEKLSPILDRHHRDWIAAQKCRAACVTGNREQAERFGSQLPDDYHRGIVERLKTEKREFKRVQLSVPFIQQYRLTCVPATLTMLCRFWQVAVDQVEVAETICYDGTPSHRARRWAEGKGMFAREFTLDWDIGVALLDRQIPFAVYTTEATSAHVQVVAGYDELRRTLIIRNPSFPQIQEVGAEQFIKRYAASGPACMVLVPAEKKELLDGLNFSDSEFYDRLRKIQQSLEEHRRGEAGAELAEMKATTPEHWLAWTAARAVSAYDTNLIALNECFDQLLTKFPTDGNLLLGKFGILREIGRREDRLDFLDRVCASPEADPVFQQQLAGELMTDARQYPKVFRILKRALRKQPLNVYSMTTLAQLYWNERKFDEALDLYRFAACLEETKEPSAQTYFSAANAQRQTESALKFLERRWNGAIAKSPHPFITWFNALQQLGRSQEALKELEEALRKHPEHGDLWLTAADFYTRHGNFTRAEQCLEGAQNRVQRAALLRVRAELARYRTDFKTARALWEEVLQTEPLSMPVHRSRAMIIAETNGREATLKCLEEVCERFPHHYQLHQLWCEWVRDAGQELSESVTRKLVEAHPSDAWARRQLALVLAEAGRNEEALAEADEGLRLSPQLAVSQATRAHILMNLGRTKEAQEGLRQAIRLAVDYSPAIYELVNSYHTVSERCDALQFIERELVKQVVYGDGLSAYRDAARLNLVPPSLLASLRVALRERPDLAVAWSVVIRQLAEMLQLDEALALAREATERFPLNEQLWQDLAMVYRLRLDTKGEQHAWQQAVTLSPTSGGSPRMLANLFERLGDIPRAQEMLEEACARAPLDPYCHGALALLLWRQGRQAEAIDRMRHTLKVYPGYGWGWQTLGSWAAATNQPTLAEELAQMLVLQRPGEIRSMLVLGRLLATSNRLPEALEIVTRAVQSSERNIEARALQAEILAALGRHAEADAACESDIWGPKLPAGLQSCRARLEAQRGNLVSAIERMEKVLKENPGFIEGWHNLADWYWRRKEHMKAVDAMTTVRRLDPLNPVPLGYRASMKLQKGDRAGAKADLERALKLDPAYSYAAINLFDLQIAESDLNGATHTLELIKRYDGGEQYKTCEIKFRTKFLAVSNSQSAEESKFQQLGAHELDEAFSRFKELCQDKTAATDAFDTAVKTLVDAGQGKRLDQALNEAIKLPDCNPAVGTWWMRRRQLAKWSTSAEPVYRLCDRSEAARQAVITLIESMAEQKKSRTQGILIIYVFTKLFETVESWSRVFALRRLVKRHQGWLNTHDQGWGSIGYAWVRLGYFGFAIRQLQDWRERSNLKMWMLLNLAIALRQKHRWEELRGVLDYAMTLERDGVFPKIRLMYALEQALQGNTAEAAAQFREVDTASLSNYMQVQYRCVQGMLAVQQAQPSLRLAVSRKESEGIMWTVRKYHALENRVDYPRCLARMKEDAKAA